MNYNQFMKFEWDEDKGDTCFKERGFDFVYALRAFLDPKRSYAKIPVGVMERIATRCWELSSIRYLWWFTRYAAALFESFKREKRIIER